MEIKVQTEGAKACITLEGKLTVQTAPELEEVISGLDAEVNEIEIDLSAVDYVASAGLRVLVAAEKLAVSREGSMRLLHPNDDVNEVFNMTGLADVFTIER